MSKRTNKFAPEVHEGGSPPLALDQEGEHSSRGAAITSIAAMIGCSSHTLLEWVKKDAVADRLKALKRENRELRQDNKVLRKASAYFA